MNLLLLLSAMLSALTGAVTGVRTDAPRQVATAAVAIVAESVNETDTEVAARPTTRLPGLVAVAAMPLARTIVVTGLPQPYASRRRE